jgi:hypothetical protein
MKLSLAIRIVLLFLVIFLGERLVTPITWTILVFIVTITIAADTMMDFKLRNRSKVQKLLGLGLLMLMCVLLGSSLVRFWRDRDLLLRSAVQGGYNHILEWSLSHVLIRIQLTQARPR